jgi:NTP pyrophosphatase (non-canonical NTP hydrolase)
MTVNGDTIKALESVYAERQRQDAKWGSQRDLSDPVWLAILTEEVGESAQEVLTRIPGNEEAGKGHGDLREELVQVAAVAVAWVEALDIKERDDTLVLCATSS